MILWCDDGGMLGNNIMGLPVTLAPRHQAWRHQVAAKLSSRVKMWTLSWSRFVSSAFKRRTSEKKMKCAQLTGSEVMRDTRSLKSGRATPIDVYSED